MKEKFTQGEWAVKDKSSLGTGETNNIVRMEMEKKNKYGAVPYAVIGGFPDEDPKVEIEANAHLIAVAPEMYHKLYEMELFMEQMHEADTDWTIKESQLHHEELRNLLCKARGE